MEYIVNNSSDEIKLEVGSILQSDKYSTVFMIIETEGSYLGRYGLLKLKKSQIIAYNDCMYDLLNKYFDKECGSYTILTQTVPAVFEKEV